MSLRSTSAGFIVIMAVDGESKEGEDDGWVIHERAPDQGTAA